MEVLIPGHTGVFSFSQLNEWNRCQMQWHFSYREGWTPTEKAKALERGSVWHEILRRHYLNQPYEAVQAYLRGLLEAGAVTSQLLQIIDQLSWLYDNYVEWSSYHDRGQETVAVEQHFEIPLKTPKRRGFIFQGYVDQIYSQADRVWVRDHKTYSRSPISQVEAMMDPQMPAYCLALTALGYEPFGIEFNQVNTYEYKKRDEVTPDKLFVRERTYRTPVELENYTLEVAKTVDSIIDNYENPRRNLMRECRMCKFQDPCLLNLKGIPLADCFSVNDSYRKKETFQDVQG